MGKHAYVMGWDVGGAHVKAALLNDEEVALCVVQVACPLWLGLDALKSAISKVLAQMPVQAAQHVITMTGELADIFPNRHEGVVGIVEVMQQQLTGTCLYFAGLKGFVAFEQVAQLTQHIASANWLASAGFVAAKFEQALLIDFGSTTTDFVLIAQGKPQVLGFSDAARLQYDELVYTGLIRTPLMALSHHIELEGRLYGIAAEHFATTADVYRLLDLLDEEEDMTTTADGTDKSMQSSARRIARMVGHDYEDKTMQVWIDLAEGFKQKQLNLLQKAAIRHFSRNMISTTAPMVFAGTGARVLAPLAAALGRDFYPIQQLITAQNELTKHWASVCLPAYAVASLAIKNA